MIPPSLSVDNQDAGQNSPPAIVAVRSDQQELKEPGPVVFDRGTGSLAVEVIDTDVNDTLFVKVFVDYNLPDETPSRANCTAAPVEAPRRSVTCDLGALCLTADVGQQRSMTVVVFDRLVLDSGEPKFQAMPEGGLSTNRFYFLRCQEPMN